MAAVAAAAPEVLSREVRDDIASLGGVANLVEAHLTAAAVLLDDDPDESLRHAAEARRLAPRVGVVREAVGVAKYRTGDYAGALPELRAARRITGRDEVVPLIADCERGLGHPEKALDIANSRVHLADEDRLELLLVGAGARMDLGQPDAAALMLEVPLLDSDAKSVPSMRIKYVYASALEQAGRPSEAATWFGRAALADEDGETDAHERAVALSEAAAGAG